MDLHHTARHIAHAYHAPPTGVRSRIQEADTVCKVLEAVEAGNYLEVAADLAGLSKPALYDWLKRGEHDEPGFREFRDAVKRCSARAEALEVQKVRKAGENPRFWAASMTYLERRHPDRWARRSESAEGPRVIVQLGTTARDIAVLVAPGAPPQDRPLLESE